MISRFFPLVGKEDTVLNYYALPLIGVSRELFGDNFLSTHLTADGRYVFIKLLKDTYSNTEMPDKMYIKGAFYTYYKVPNKYKEDVQLLLQSKYSSLSDKAKACIKGNSGLMYKQVNRGKKYTSKLLYALDKAPTLQQYMFECLKSGDNSETDTELHALLKQGELAERLQAEDVI